MFSQPRLHIARIAAVAADPFLALFAECTEAARARLSQQTTDLAALWDFAQYLDLVDAGYGSKTDSLYRIVLARCSAYLTTHGAVPAVKTLCARTCALANMLLHTLDQESEGAEAPVFQEAAAA
jgi:hypothetical protein